MAMFGEADYQVTWYPFFLNPRASKTPVDKKEYYEKKFGKERVEPMFRRLKMVGEAEGITFADGGTTGHTLQSHRLIHFAQGKGKGDEMIERVFKGFFEETKCLQSNDELSALASDIGLDQEETKTFLESNEGVEEVLQQAEQMRSKYGVTGVPFFVVNDRFSFSGAQDPQYMVSVFQKVLS
uniref:DSBA-like thioredoxin domain-containing protein n=1 Tax=Paramoeba aestuarina TaxID=180227 RepID=A0A7S4NPE3_9EUKA|mmetsp:Transcript_22081/g.34313  ORF Transcript_22081/g.34313 Transcript_22081/m.34313 type:complete len:182 (+) Transcript_22081:130-675(+)|eukprot:CAMPEP_0201509034 /NCGR_PEP_ID=MMETSP0161_2-20130828/2203_1 /ASSEMBLY_ACC=CAM_ASM_000251 /TAXON_ID=180227 /ORGANISM="Neoparamoeba aestuarina, Strain SoJaBio B1-5/56/2" /LENGTH=181 /DNA_ID=CAMNT_0047903865 /DNA_START=70 /DNA_END=615 /DNA_ORIENTATION=-